MYFFLPNTGGGELGNGGEKVVNGPGMRLGTCGKEVGRPAGAGEGGRQEQEKEAGRSRRRRRAGAEGCHKNRYGNI